jgi:hypothetical protein
MAERVVAVAVGVVGVVVVEIDKEKFHTMPVMNQPLYDNLKHVLDIKNQ